ncbi:hypothetical protein [Streptomyces sp. NPDC005435]|uniref:hypothetical protein n=1 Tax=Streptomyces sp. NPDC005435 TaxID=3154464 RepID=UPI003452081E
MAMGAAVVALGAAPAFADGLVYSGDGAASVGWLSDGDRLHLCDEKADGHSAVGILYVDGVKYKTYWQTAGANTCSEYGNSWIAEGTPVKLTACVGESSTGEYGNCVSRPDHGKSRGKGNVIH